MNLTIQHTETNMQTGNKKIRQIKLIFNIGFGYWKDRFNGEYGVTGHYHVIVVPFFIIRFGNVTKVVN